MLVNHRYYTSLTGSTEVNGSKARLRTEGIKLALVLRSYCTSLMVFALVKILDLAYTISPSSLPMAAQHQSNTWNTAAGFTWLPFVVAGWILLLVDTTYILRNNNCCVYMTMVEV